jgi:hypothetical protein
MMVLAVPAVLLFVSIQPAADTRAKPVAAISVFVRVPPGDDGLVPIDQQERQDSANDLTKALRKRLAKDTRLATTAEDANVFVDVMGRDRDGDDRIVRLRVRVGTITTTVDGLNDDSDWSDAAGDAAKKIADWLRVNNDHILKAIAATAQ